MPSGEARDLAIAPFASAARAGGVGDASLWKSHGDRPQLLLAGEMPCDAPQATLFEVDIFSIAGCETGPWLCFDFGQGFDEEGRVRLVATSLSARLFSAAVVLDARPARIRLDPCAGAGEFLCSEVRVSAIPRERLRASREVPARLPRPAAAADGVHRKTTKPAAAPEGLADAMRIGAILHLFYEDLWPEMRDYLGRVPSLERLYVSIPQDASRGLEGRIADAFPGALVRRVANRGRDVLPFLQWLDIAAHEGIGLVCKIHTKRSPHLPTGEAWRRDMLDKLLGSEQAVRKIVSSFRAHPSLGIVGPAGHVVPSSFFWESNASRVEEVSLKMGSDVPGGGFSYVAGSMFWARVDSLLPLLRIGLRDADFEAEAGHVDGTLAHAIERCFAIAATISGFRVAETQPEPGASTRTVFDFAPLPPEIRPPLAG